MSIEDVMKRAGASDTDYENWLAERRNGLTATEVKHLYMGGSIDELALLKLMPVKSSFTSSKYLTWGKEREPLIADEVSKAYPYLAHESRVFRSASNDRYLASPDMIGVDEVERIALAEIKTSKYDLTPGSDHFDKTGYMYQMQWQMFVLDAAWCVFAWERHHDDWVTCSDGIQRPQTISPVEHEVIMRDDALIDQLVQTAEKFFAVMDEIKGELS